MTAIVRGRRLFVQGSILAAFLLLLAAVAGSMAVGRNGNSGPPRVVVPEEPLALGEALPGEQLTGTFTIKNGGGEPLQILKLETGCECAGALLSRECVPPGEKAVVQISARIKEEGQHLVFLVRIRTNDPNTPVAEYRVSAAAATPVVRTEPKEADFGEIAQGTGSAVRLKLMLPNGQRWPADKKIEANCSGGQAQVTLIDDKGGLVAELRPRVDLPLGEFAETLVLQPSGSDRSWRVALRGRVVPKFVVSPTAVYFGDADLGKEPMKRTVLLRRTDGQPWPRITKMTAPANVQIEHESGTSSRCVLRITLKPGSVKEDVKDGTIQVWLEGEREPVDIGVMIFRKRT